MMNCPKCKYQNLHGANYCEKCGLDLKQAAKMAANPMPSAVRPYGGYGSSYEGGRSYGSTPRPTAAPQPMPAPRPTAAGRPTTPPVQSTPAVPVPPAAKSRPPRPKPASKLRTAAPAPAAAPPVRREPLPFGRLVDKQGREYPLRYDENLIGRASPGEGINPAVDLSAVDTSGSVSRRHAKIGKDDSSIYVEELGSSNGSRHNGQPLREGLQSPLNDGDELIFGSLVFTFHKI